MYVVAHARLSLRLSPIPWCMRPRTALLFYQIFLFKKPGARRYLLKSSGKIQAKTPQEANKNNPLCFVFVFFAITGVVAQRMRRVKYRGEINMIHHQFYSVGPLGT
jgi:hypothetical protein